MLSHTSRKPDHMEALRLGAAFQLLERNAIVAITVHSYAGKSGTIAFNRPKYLLSLFSAIRRLFLVTGLLLCITKIAV